MGVGAEWVVVSNGANRVLWLGNQTGKLREVGGWC